MAEIDVDMVDDRESPENPSILLFKEWTKWIL